MKDDREPDLTLDCRGMLCPMPVIMLGKRYAALGAGALIAVLADDEAARVDIPAWSRMRGQTYLGEDAIEDGTPRYWVRRV